MKKLGAARSRILTSATEVSLVQASAPLVITASSTALGWQGIELEKGRSCLFEPVDAQLPFHYFAMLTSDPYSWEWKDSGRFRRHTMYPGQIWVNPAGVPFTHRVYKYSEFLLLRLEQDKVLASVPDAKVAYGSEFRRVHNADDPHLRAVIYALAAEVEAGGPNGRLYVDSLTTALSLHFLKMYGVERLALEAHGGLSKQRLARVLDFMDAHLTADVSLDELANTAGLSKYHFIRAFKQTTGTTPSKFFRERRLERGMELLKRSELPTNQIAFMLGFSDQSHFGRAFKQRFRVTPGDVTRGIG